MSHLVPLKQRPITAVRKRGQLLIPKRFKYPGTHFPMSLTIGQAAGQAGYAEGLFGALDPIDPIDGLKTFEGVQVGQILSLAPLSGVAYSGSVWVEIPAITMPATELAWNGNQYTDDTLDYFTRLDILAGQTIPVTAWIVI